MTTKIALLLTSNRFMVLNAAQFIAAINFDNNYGELQRVALKY